MTRLLPPLAALLATLAQGSCSGQVALAGGGPRVLQPADAPRVGNPPRETERAEPRPAVPREWVDAICDRVEDCAVERNATLAKESGGSEKDVDAARREAQQILVSGAVRSFCQMRTTRLGRRDAERIHGCLKTQQGCDTFYRCARFPDAGAGAGSRPRAGRPTGASATKQ